MLLQLERGILKVEVCLVLNIFICEDNEIHRKNISTVAENYVMIEDLDMKIALTTGNPYDIIEYLGSNQGAGLYFLDIDLSCELNGLKLAEEIRKYDPRGFIVFITTHSESLELIFRFKLEAMDFISKDDWPRINQRICECIQNAHIKYTSAATDLQKNFTFRSIGEKKIIAVPYSDILYFEISPNSSHKVNLFIIGGMYEFSSKLDAIEKNLGKDFYRCHKSFIVNLKNINTIDEEGKTIQMHDGSTCFCAERKIKKLKKLLSFPSFAPILF